jgi:hypothetical protein
LQLLQFSKNKTVALSPAEVAWPALLKELNEISDKEITSAEYAQCRVKM